MEPQPLLQNVKSRLYHDKSINPTIIQIFLHFNLKKTYGATTFGHKTVCYTDARD